MPKVMMIDYSPINDCFPLYSSLLADRVLYLANNIFSEALSVIGPNN